MSNEIQDLIQRGKSLRGNRDSWESLWQELAEMFLLPRADFTREPVAGENRGVNIFDSTPMQARRSLSASVGGLLKPKNVSWFEITVDDEDLAELDEVKLWLDDSTSRLAKAIYQPTARFLQRSGEVDDSLVTFGTGALFIGESRDLGQLMFRSIPLKRIAIAENSDGVVDTIFIDHPLTARQAVQRWGEDKVGEKTREALRETKSADKVLQFLQVIQPRQDRDKSRLDDVNMPFMDIVIDIDSEHKILESGFQEFPVAVPRWDTSPDEIYGRSPAMIALGDALTLQAQGETILRAGQMAVDPSLLVADDSVFGDVLTYPGGITYYDAEMAIEMRRIPIEPLNTGANIPLGRDMQKDSRDLVQQAFFRNIFRLPVAGPQMTATEIIERKEEFVREIGPSFGRLESDYIAVIVDRSFNIVQRGGGFLPPPDVLVDREVEFELASPIERVRKQIEGVATARAMELMGPFIAFQPDVVDNFDPDEIARDTPDIFGMPQRYIRPKDDVAAMRGARAEQQRAAENAAQAQQIADIAATGAGAAKDIQEVTG